MLMVSFHHQNVWEVLAKAEGLTLLPGAEKKNSNDRHLDQTKDSALASLQYGGASLLSIFTSNKSLNGAQDASGNEKDLIATFSTQAVYQVKAGYRVYMHLKTPTQTKKGAKPAGSHSGVVAPFYIEIVGPKVANPPIIGNDGDRCEELEDSLDQKDLSKTSLRMFFDTKKREDKYGFDALNSLLKRTDCWPDQPSSLETVDSPNALQPAPLNYLSLSGILNLELTYSNTFAYYFRKPKVLKRVLAPLKILDFAGDTYTIFREKENVDILCKGQQHLILIENKILSDLNGRDKSFQDQLDKIFSSKDSDSLIDDLEAEEKSDSGHEVSQLSKYYAYGQLLASQKGFSKEDVLYLLFVPDYQRFFLNKEKLSHYLFGRKYWIVFYSDLKDAFQVIANRPEDYDLTNKETLLLGDFLEGLSYQAQETDCYYENEMKRRFLNAIYTLNHPKQ